MNKKVSLFIASLFLGFLATTSMAQTISTMENLALSPNAYWNGSTTPSGTTFTSGNAIFPNFYSPDWGGYWVSGWAYSTMTDTTTAGAGNMYSAIAGKGAVASNTYLVGQQNAMVHIAHIAQGRLLEGLFVTNSTYTALSMAEGDMFAKKFGGTTGNDPDWLKLTIQKWDNGILSNQTVEFYLADFRFEDNTKDYILKDWEWIDLSLFGATDSLEFTLSSSDVGNWGMNTPAFFCIDNLTTTDVEVAISDTKTPFKCTVYPNPTTEWITLHLPHSDTYTITLTDNAGRTIIQEKHYQTTHAKIDVSPFESGIYILHITSNKETFSQKIIKE